MSDDNNNNPFDITYHLREYVNVMATEPESLIPLSKVYHDLKRILGDEE
jgi:hypothetical protein